MRPPASRPLSVPRRGPALLALVALAVSACAGSGAATPTGSVVTAASSTPVASVSAAPATTAPKPTVAPSASPLAALSLLWEKGGPSTVKAETYWPAIDPVTGNIWVAHSFEDKYWIFSPDGKFLEAWGTPGKGAGQFKLTTNDPNPDAVGAIAFAPDGSFYVADNGNDRVEKFDKDRHFVTAWGSFGTGDGQFASPKGIATDGKTVYVSDDPRGDVQAFDTNGHFLRSLPFPFVLFTLAPSGHLFVADRTGVLELDGLGKQVAHFDLDFAAMGGFPGQIAVDKAGHIFVEIQDATASAPIGLVELDPHGAILNRWSTGGETLTLAPDGKAAYLAFTAGSKLGWDFIRKYALP
jgi:hypothetical protein